MKKKPSRKAKPSKVVKEFPKCKGMGIEKLEIGYVLRPYGEGQSYAFTTQKEALNAIKLMTK